MQRADDGRWWRRPAVPEPPRIKVRAIRNQSRVRRGGRRAACGEVPVQEQRFPLKATCQNTKMFVERERERTPPQTGAERNLLPRETEREGIKGRLCCRLILQNRLRSISARCFLCCHGCDWQQAEWPSFCPPVAFH